MLLTQAKRPGLKSKTLMFDVQSVYVSELLKGVPQIKYRPSGKPGWEKHFEPPYTRQETKIGNVNVSYNLSLKFTTVEKYISVIWMETFTVNQ